VFRINTASKQASRAERISESARSLIAGNQQRDGTGAETATANASMVIGGIKIATIEFGQGMAIKKT
jgi:hypothetical protein